MKRNDDDTVNIMAVLPLPDSPTGEHQSKIEATYNIPSDNMHDAIRKIAALTLDKPANDKTFSVNEFFTITIS